MAVLTAKERKDMKVSKFGLPTERKYPMPDKAHAANAKARATQMVKKGKLSKSSEEKIDAKANKILYGAHQKIEKMHHHLNKLTDHLHKIKHEGLKHEAQEEKENKKHVKFLKKEGSKEMTKHEKEKRGMVPY
jgi:uncharacterized coiled-coil protein SlyX